MIVKVACDGWVIYSGFDKIRYEYKPQEEIKKLDTDASWYLSDGDSSHHCLIVARKENGKEFSIKTNCPVFLLNDDGKTIEKIN